MTNDQANEKDAKAAPETKEECLEQLRRRLTSHIGRRLAGIAAAALLLAAFHSLGWLTATFEAMGRGHVVGSDQAYLSQSVESGRDSFLMLSGLQGGLHMVSSGSAGVSFIVDIEARLGELLTPLVMMVDRATEVALAGMVAAETLSLALRAADAVAEPLLGAVLLLFALYAVARLFTEAPNAVSRFSGEVAELLLIAFLTLYLALPLAIYGAAELSKSFTAPLAAEAHGHFSELNDHLGQSGKQDDLKGSVHGVISDYESLGAKLSHKIHQIGEALKRHIVVFVLDVVFFPLALLWFFYRVARVIARHLVGPIHTIEVVGAELERRAESVRS